MSNVGYVGVFTNLFFVKAAQPERAKKSKIRVNYSFSFGFLFTVVKVPLTKVALILTPSQITSLDVPSSVAKQPPLGTTLTSIFSDVSTFDLLFSMFFKPKLLINKF